jgi:hypothetical protein
VHGPSLHRHYAHAAEVYRATRPDPTFRPTIPP